MALPSSSSTPSALSASDINTENGYASNQQMSFDDAVVRSLAGAPGTGTTISMALLRGKSRKSVLHYTAPKQNANLSNDFPGVPTASIWEVYVDPGVYLWSDSTALPGLTTGTSSWPAGLNIINQGYIIGKGGDGAAVNGYNGFDPSPTNGFAYGFPGGPALELKHPATIDNTNPAAYIAGGGGGGMCGRGANLYRVSGGGGGAGGGKGGDGFGGWPPSTAYSQAISPKGPSAGGAGGAIGQKGADGSARWQAGGGGGRQLPGAFTGPPGGLYQRQPNGMGGFGGGAGGGSGPGQGWLYTDSTRTNVAWGQGSVASLSDGGSANNPGQRSWSTGIGPTGGGGWGAPGGGYDATTRSYFNGPAVQGTYAGAPGGKAVTLNGYTVTFINNDQTRVWGAVA